MTKTEAIDNLTAYVIEFDAVVCNGSTGTRLSREAIQVADLPIGDTTNISGLIDECTAAKADCRGAGMTDQEIEDTITAALS